VEQAKIVEAVAALLRKLADAAAQRAAQQHNNAGFQGSVGQVPRTPGKTPEEEAYEHLVGRLDEVDRAALDQLIRKMLSP
jgi:hypothetical protein